MFLAKTAASSIGSKWHTGDCLIGREPAAALAVFYGSHPKLCREQGIGYGSPQSGKNAKKGAQKHQRQVLRLAIAMDKAFCFYYNENLELLNMLGVELKPFFRLWRSLCRRGSAACIWAAATLSFLPGSCL